jgi:carotenoid cleavage oxygenase
VLRSAVAGTKYQGASIDAKRLGVLQGVPVVSASATVRACARRPSGHFIAAEGEPMTVTVNPYLAGNFAPVRDERDDSGLAVTGAIPPDLDGLLLRNGPNPILDPDPGRYHWFNGDGMLHGIELAGGRARYRNRWVRTRAACQALGEPAPAGPPEVNGLPVSANTNVVAHAGRIFALVESSLPTEVRAELSTIGATDFGGRLTTPFTAHPKIDPVSGELVFFGYDLAAPYLRYHVVDAAGALARSEAIDLPRSVMIHDFGVTATRVVWLDLPVVFDSDLVDRQPFPFSWQPEYGARVGVMPRSDGNGELVWVDLEPCYVYHVLNAYDAAEGTLVIDVVRYPDMFATETYGPGASRGTRLERWTIDPTSGAVTSDTLDDTSQEFPRINDRYLGRQHRYGYTSETTIGASWAGHDSLRKHDLVAGTTERHNVGPGRAAGEPVFATAPTHRGEDDGWILSVVYDAARDASDVIVIDATNFQAAPVATIHLPRRVPFGFHGSWIPGASLG